MAKKRRVIPPDMFHAEKRVSMKETRKVLDIPPKTIRRYIYTGLMSHITGQRVKLECFQDGPSLCTTVEAYERFRGELNGY